MCKCVRHNTCHSIFIAIVFPFNVIVHTCVVCVVASHQTSETALDWASYNGHLQVVRLLLGRGSEVECRDEVRQS